MPPPYTAATRWEPSAEDATEDQFWVGATDSVQFVPEFAEGFAVEVDEDRPWQAPGLVGRPARAVVEIPAHVGDHHVVAVGRQPACIDEWVHPLGG